MSITKVYEKTWLQQFDLFREKELEEFKLATSLNQAQDLLDILVHLRPKLSYQTTLT